jgi:type I restriction enzyme, S subunit
LRLANSPSFPLPVKPFETLVAAIEPRIDATAFRAHTGGQADKLTPSLLARAFAGKLVPQDANDEPAEKLLELIKTNHESKSDKDARK